MYCQGKCSLRKRSDKLGVKGEDIVEFYEDSRNIVLKKMK